MRTSLKVPLILDGESGTTSTLLMSDGFTYDFGTADGRGHDAGKLSYINSVVGMGGNGINYTAVNGSWKTSNGRATPRALTTSPLYAHADAGQADVSVSAKVWRGAGAMGLVARWIDDNNYLYIRTDGSNLIMHERVSGTNTQVFSEAITYTGGGTILLELDGTAYTAYYEGAQVSAGTVNSALNTGTEVGPWTNNANAGNEIDDLTVYVFPDVQIAPDDLSVATITIGDTAELTSNLYMGATYTHNTFPSGGNATAVAAAKALIDTLGIIHIHLRHFGFSNNMSAQASGADEATRVTNTINGENISFTEHDAVMQLLADNGVTEVWLKAWGFPDWMLDTGSGSGASNQTFQTQYRAEAAAYVQAFIKRYNTDTTISGIKIIAVSFTHEEKGGYSSDNARTVADFDAIAVAVKSQDATVTVHGPYSVPRGAGLVNFGYADSTDTREPLVAQDVTDNEYFLANSTEQDGLTFSMKSWVDAVTAPSYETVVKILPYWGRLLDEIKRLSGYASESISADEFYAFNINDWSDYTDAQQAVIHAAALYYFVRHGGKYLAHWMIEAPQSERKYALWNSTLEGPTLTTTPVYDVHQAYRDDFSNGTGLLPVTISGDTAGLLVLAQTNKVLAINLRESSRSVSVDNVSHTLSAYEAKTIDRPVQYLLRDDFTDTAAAGSVDGTRATAGPGVRNVDDTALALSIGNGSANFTSGASTGDPDILYESLNRVAGRILVAKFNATTLGFSAECGWATGDAGNARGGIIFEPASGQLRTWIGVTRTDVSDALSASTSYTFYLILRAPSGAQLFIKGGSYASISLLWVSSLQSSTSLFPRLIGGVGTEHSFDTIRVPEEVYLSSPVVSDGFTSSFGTTDGKGHAEGVTGGIGSGGSGGVWIDQGDWSTSGGKAINSPSLGSELITNGNFETDTSGWSAIRSSLAVVSGGQSGNALQVTRSGNPNGYAGQQFGVTIGRIYVASVYQQNGTSIGSVLLGYGFGQTQYYSYTQNNASWTQSKRTLISESATLGIALNCLTNGGTSLYDTVSIKELSFDDSMSVINCSISDVYVSTKINQISTGMFAGLVLCVDDEDDPQNMILTYHDGVAVTTGKRVSGTYTELNSTSSTFSADAELTVSKIDNEVRVYYNNVFIFSDTISDSSVTNNTKHGLFSTDSDNQMSDFVVYASTDYTELDKYVS